MGELRLGAASAAALAAAMLLVGCNTTLTGTARKAPVSADSDGAIVAMMNTGPYATTPGRPLGAAGDDRQTQGLLEAARMAEFVVGPWAVDDALHQRPDALLTGNTGPIATTAMMVSNQVLGEQYRAIADKFGFVAGFTSMRISAPGTGPQRSLKNVVLRFSDPPAAAAAAKEMSEINDVPPGNPPGVPLEIADLPDTAAKSYELPGGMVGVQSFTAHGPYVLFQAASTKVEFLGPSAKNLVFNTVIKQKPLIDLFAPTPLDKLAELPKDPTGQLLARTLVAPDNAAPFIIGAWKPRAWPHFEENPVEAGPWLDAAGVDWVTQRRANVYEAATAEKAARLSGEFADQAAALNAIRPTNGVPGLPGARCFERTDNTLPPTVADSWKRVAWSFKCFASVERYAYTTYADDLADAHQQMAAQYRILSGQ